jgi:hypothetical protein
MGCDSHQAWFTTASARPARAAPHRDAVKAGHADVLRCLQQEKGACGTSASVPRAAKLPGPGPTFGGLGRHHQLFVREAA